MKIVADEPGRRLAIEDIGGRLPFSLVALAAGVVILGAVAAGRWSLADVQDLITRRVIPAPNGELDLALFSAGLLYLISLRGGTRVDGLEVDAAQGLFSWRKSYLAGFFRWSGRLETPSVDTFTFSRTPRGGGKEELRLALRAGQRTPITFDFNVEKIDTTEKFADFALRLASLAGLSYYRVLRSDAALFEMRALRHPEPGALAVPSVAGQAQYEKGVAIPAAVRAAEERLQRFNPESFKGDLRATAWDPGREVSFEKGWSKEVLLSPLLLGVLLPFIMSRSEGLSHEPVGRILGLAFFALVGLVAALIGGFGLTSGWPRRVVIDWTRREVLITRFRNSRTIAFSAIDAIELRRLTHRHRRGRGSTLVTLHYSCDIRLALRGPAASAAGESVVETVWCRDSNEPYYMALPLAKELAAALGVEQRPTEP